MGAHARLSVHGREDSFNEGRVLQLTFFWSVAVVRLTTGPHENV